MPTIISHTAVPLALGLGLGLRRIPRRLLVAGVVASVLPDMDVVAFKFGVAYADAMGHRGFSHSLLLACLVGLAAALIAARLGSNRVTAFLFVGLCAASHGLLDMVTDAGEGVALLWPLVDERYFAPWRVIEASPLSMRRLLGARGVEILWSELRWVWVPAAGVCFALLATRTRSCAQAPQR